MTALNRYRRRLESWERELRTNRHGWAQFAPHAIAHLRAMLVPPTKPKSEYWDQIPKL